ncbi:MULTISPECIES: stealth family protein [unclassified Nocardiopsis]|uniref:stealth family protein n=1 Tax=unclassified Nocardiopsis TaxID=2649073 RepID=UPI0013584E2D|nr:MULTISPECIES: stealth family protein [unclassified Nocardiopsis]
MSLRSRVNRFRSQTLQDKKRHVAELLWRQRSAANRRALLNSDTSLRMVTVDDQILPGRVVDNFTAQDAAADNLGYVTDALEAAGISYFLVPSPTAFRHTVGVHQSEQRAFLDSLLKRQGRSAVYISRPRNSTKFMHTMVCADNGLNPVLAEAEVLRIGEIRIGGEGQLLGTPELGCDVEFWRDGAKLLDSPAGQEALAWVQPQASEEVFRDSLVAPRRNLVSDVLPSSEQKPATIQVRGRDFPTFQGFTVPTTHDVTFPIDVVYTWVDGEEPALREKRARYKGEAAQILDKETNSSRYTSHDELKYSLRSLEMYAPFVRNVYIVTDGQTPSWLDTSQDRVRVVDHREIFPEDALPVFNSHAIETRLHHIPGLSEHYLYLNDDVFFGRPVTPQHFFHGNGIIKVPVSPLKIGLGSPRADETATNSASKNVRKLLEGVHGKFTTNNFLHTPLPQRRSVLLELEELFPEEFARTARSRFRAPTDIAVTSPMHYNHALMTGLGIPGKYSYRYVNVSREDADRLLGDISQRRHYAFFCLNEVDVPEESRDEVHRRMSDFLNHYFPFPSPAEKP